MTAGWCWANESALRRATGIGQARRQSYGQTLICLINLRKHDRTFQGVFRKLGRVLRTTKSSQRPLDVASHATSQSQLRSRAVVYWHDRLARVVRERASSDSFSRSLRGSDSGNSRGNESRRHAARRSMPGPIGTGDLQPQVNGSLG